MNFIKKNFREILLIIFIFTCLTFFYLFAWNPPTDNPPNANLPAPINTSSSTQTKEGSLYIGGLLRVGLFSSHPTGTNGALYYNTSDHKFYGYQNGSWSELGGGGFWVQSGDNIYNTNSGNVGIGTTNPAEKLEVFGNIKLGGENPTYRITNVAPPINENDTATKGYVDAAAGQGTCSGNILRIFFTTQTYKGNLGGWEGADTKCAAEYPGSHFCRAEEIVAFGLRGCLPDDDQYLYYAELPNWLTPLRGWAGTGCVNWTTYNNTYSGNMLMKESQGWSYDIGDKCIVNYRLACCE